MFLRLVITALVLIVCSVSESKNSEIKEFRTQTSCENSGGYWYNEKCWDYIDEGVSPEDVENRVAEEMRIINSSFLKLDGENKDVELTFIEPDSGRVIIYTIFGNREKNIILSIPYEKMETSEPFKTEAQLLLGNLMERGSEIKKVAEGVVSVTPIEEELFLIKGNFEKEDGSIYTLQLQTGSAVMGGGSTEFKVEGSNVYLSGELGTITYLQMKELIKDHPEVDTIIFTDVPGSLNDDINLHTARLVRNNGFKTVIYSDGHIASGGVDLFCAGVERTVYQGAKIGVHSWGGGEGETAIDFPKDHPVHKYQVNYFNEMFGDDKGSDFYFYTIEAAPFDSIHYMSDDEIVRWKVATKFIKE